MTKEQLRLIAHAESILAEAAGVLFGLRDGLSKSDPHYTAVSDVTDDAYTAMCQLANVRMQADELKG